MNFITKDLTWSDFHSKEQLRGFTKKSSHTSAIYIWGWFNTDNAFIPFYVGKHKNLYQRLFEHIGSLNGGHYTLYDKTFVLSGKFKPSRIDPTVKPIYMPMGFENFIDDFMAPNVQQTVRWYIDNIYFVWMITNPHDNSYLEKYVTFQLEKNGRYITSFVKGYKNIDTNQIISFSGNPAITQMLI